VIAVNSPPNVSAVNEVSDFTGVKIMVEMRVTIVCSAPFADESSELAKQQHVAIQQQISKLGDVVERVGLTFHDVATGEPIGRCEQYDKSPTGYNLN